MNRLSHRLDRYVLATFLRHWTVVAAAFLGLFTLLDLVGKSDEYGQSADLYGPVASEVVRLYLVNLPFLLAQFAPYVTLLAGLASVLSLRRVSEWTPMLTAGRSTLRAFLPIFAAALVMGVLMLVMREALLPRLLPERAALTSRLVRQEAWEPQNVWLRSLDGRRLHCALYQPLATHRPGAASGLDQADAVPTMVGLEVFGLSSLGQDRLLSADVARWDGVGWELENGFLITLGGVTDRQPVARLDGPGMAPADLERSWFGQHQPLELSAADYRQLLARDPGHRQAATLAWSWWLAPWHHLILLLLGLPYVLRFERGASMEGLAIGLLLCSTFFVAEFLFHDFGDRGLVAPWLAALAPTLLFTGFGLRALQRLPT